MIYLKGLNTLRFFAAFLVTIYHCNDALSQVDQQLNLTWPILTKGAKAVDFFFILSGFLLTYLSLVQLTKTNKFDYVSFFRKRAVRILPLYYLAVLLGFLLIGFLYPRVYGSNIFEFSIVEGLSYYLLFIPNWAAAKYAEVGPLRSLWSIGVEEQFYLFFPLLIFFIRSEKYRLLRIGIFLLLTVSIYLFLSKNSLSLPEPIGVFYVQFFRIHFIFLGCLFGAIFYKFNGTQIQLFLGNKFFQTAIWLLFIGLLFLPNSYDPHNLIAAFLFSLMLIILSNDSSIINLEIPPFVYLGAISFGIYIYHPYVSIVTRFLMQKNLTMNELIYSFPILFYLIVLIVTLFIAHFSYKYYESFFLKFK